MNIRKIIEKILAAQFRGKAIKIKELLPSEERKRKAEASDGAVYNALKVLTKADILIRRFQSGRQRSLEINYEYAFEKLALYKVGEKAVAVSYLPEGARVEVVNRYFRILRSDAIAEHRLIMELIEKYRDDSEDSDKVHKYFLARAVDHVLQFVEKWDVNKDPRKFINHMILTGVMRTAFEQMLAARDGGKWSE